MDTNISSEVRAACKFLAVLVLLALIFALSGCTYHTGGIASRVTMPPATISLSLTHTAVILPDGSLWTWGRNWSGQLGDGTFDHSEEPVRVGNDTDWMSVAARGNNTFALRNDGSLWRMGTDDWSGQENLPAGVNIPHLVPGESRPISEILAMTAIAAGQYHTVAIGEDGMLFAWGWNGTEALGFRSHWHGRIASWYPGPIGTDMDWVNVASASTHNIALKEDGTIWSWGDGDGQERNIRWGNHFTKVQIGTDTDWGSIATGDWHSLALKHDGSMWAWRTLTVGTWNSATGTFEGQVHTALPIQIGTDNDWAIISAGRYHSLAIKNDGTIWAWGGNGFGQLGDGTNIDRTEPVQIGSCADWISVGACRMRTVAMKADGSVWSWGEGYAFGASPREISLIGDGKSENSNTPVMIIPPLYRQ